MRLGRIANGVIAVMLLSALYYLVFSDSQLIARTSAQLHDFGRVARDGGAATVTVTVAGPTITIAPRSTRDYAALVPYTSTQRPFAQIRIEEPRKYDFVVIGLHGLMSSGGGLAGWYESLGGTQMDGWEKRIKWMWPTSYKQNYKAWFQLTHKEPPLTPELINSFEEDHVHMFYTSGQIKDLINQELRNGIPSQRIFLFGFSQGCVMSLLTGLTLKVPLGGIIGFNGYVPLQRNMTDLFAEANQANQNTPVRLRTGLKDGIIHPDWTVQSAEFMRNNLSMPNVEYEVYETGGHKLNTNTVKEMVDWLIERLRALDG